MPFCPTCEEWTFRLERHTCPPEWETFVLYYNAKPEKDDRWPRYRARDAEDAAVKAAEIYDQEDYPLLKGDTATILVRLPGTSEIARFEVGGESVPHYHAQRLPDETPTEAEEAA